MPRTERVVLTLGAFQEGGHSALGTQRFKAGVASGEQLVRISLMSHIPHELIFGRLKRGVQGDREFNDAKSCANVTTSACAHIDEARAHVRRERAQLVTCQTTQIGR